MSILAVGGPEKAGKTTAIAALAARLDAKVVHWGKIKSWTDYLRPLIEAVNSDEWTIFDRYWGCEWVYSVGLNRGSTLNHDMWLGQYLLGRIALTNGFMTILRGPEPGVLSARRDETDLPIDPAREQELYLRYVNETGGTVKLIDYYVEAGDVGIEDLATRLKVWQQTRQKSPVRVPFWVGDPASPLVIVGDHLHKTHEYPIALPFVSQATQAFARLLGTHALTAAWTNIDALPHGALDGRIVLACGKMAAKGVFINHHPRLSVEVAHPSWVYKQLGPEEMAAHYEEVIEKVLRSAEFARGVRTVEKEIEDAP